MLEINYTSLGKKLPCGRTFDVKNTHGLPRFHEFFCLFITHGLDLVVINMLTPGCHLAIIQIHLPDCISNHCQTPVSQKIDFQQSRIFHLVLFPFHDLHALWCREHRNVFPDLIRHDHHPPGMDRWITEHTQDLFTLF